MPRIYRILLITLCNFFALIALSILFVGGISAETESGIGVIGRNGAFCDYATIADAVAASSSGDTIYVPSSTTYNEQIGDIDKDLTFVSANINCTAATPGVNAVIDRNGLGGGAYGGIFRVLDGVTVTFTDFEMREAAAAYGGIGYVNQRAALILNSVTIWQGNATTAGGGLRMFTGSQLTMNGGILYDNDAGSGGGGAIAAATGSVLMLNDTRVGTSGPVSNFTTDDGGGIKLDGATLNMEDGSIINNGADGNGGAIHASNTSTVTLTSVQLGSSLGLLGTNRADSGGGIYANSSKVTVIDSTFDSNHANNGSGGSIYSSFGSSITLDESAILRGSATSSGGGIYVSGHSVAAPTQLHITGSDVFTNSASWGGGIYGYGEYASITVEDSTLMDNRADNYGGGVYMFGDSLIILRGSVLGTLTMTNTRLAWNSADFGGGMSLSSVDGNFNDVEVYASTAHTDGGGLYANGGNLIFSDPYFHQNASSRAGGAIYQASGTVTLQSINKVGLVQANSSFNGMGGGIAISSTNKANLYLHATEGHGFNVNNNASELGGGIYVSGGRAFVSMTGDANVTNNKADQHGGGVYVDGGSLFATDGANLVQPWIGGYNRALAGSGGGIYATNSAEISLYNTRVGNPNGFGNDAALDGGGIYASNSQIEMSNVLVTHNTASRFGGGLYLTNGSSAEQWTTYQPLNRGLAGVYCDPQDLAANVYCSEIRNNSAIWDGGGVYVDNSSFSANATALLNNESNTGNNGYAGSAIFADNGSMIDLDNSLVAQNISGTTTIDLNGGTHLDSNSVTLVDNHLIPVRAGSAETITFTNSIEWDNGNSMSIHPGASLTANCNLVQLGSLSGGAGNISINPDFVTTARGDYRLTAASPAADKCANGPTIDMDYFARPNGASHDMGAFEVSLAPTAVEVFNVSAEPGQSLVLIALLAVISLTGLYLVQKRRS